MERKKAGTLRNDLRSIENRTSIWPQVLLGHLPSSVVADRPSDLSPKSRNVIGYGASAIGIIFTQRVDGFVQSARPGRKRALRDSEGLSSTLRNRRERDGSGPLLRLLLCGRTALLFITRPARSLGLLLGHGSAVTRTARSWSLRAAVGSSPNAARSSLSSAQHKHADHCQLDSPARALVTTLGPWLLTRTLRSLTGAWVTPALLPRGS